MSCIRTARSIVPACRSWTASIVSKRARKRPRCWRRAGCSAKEEPHENTVGFSERADVPIEPRLSEQWFLKYPRVEEARAAVGPGEDDSHFVPSAGKVYDHWLENIQDWCISRQLWWGHRIPVWYRKQDRNRWQSHPRRHRAAVRRGELGAGPRRARHLVFSWLWPFATMDADHAGESFIPRPIS